VIVVFALAVRFSFVALLDSDAMARISTLARAGTAAVEFNAKGFAVNEASYGGFSLHTKSEGLEWFDHRGRLQTRRGQTPAASASPHEGAQRFESPAGVVDTYTLLLRDLRGAPRGYVRASEVYNPASDPARALDRGLFAGAMLALIAGALGGALLARSSVARVQESYERLREFTADASHELRGPIAALAGTASVALRETPDLSPLTHSRLEDIAKLARDMRRLVDDLLILARADRSMERELFVVGIDDVVANIHTRHGPAAAAKGVQLAFGGRHGLEIYGNPDQIERVVANLVENAIRHTAAGGDVEIWWTADQHRLEIVVRDTGSGIAPDHLPRVFDRFWRGDNVRSADGGSGLGLAIARALARRHGGDLSVASKPGAGSTFTLSLPLRPPSLG